MSGNSKCRWCREQAACRVVSVRVEKSGVVEDDTRFKNCEACQHGLSRYVGQLRKSLTALQDDGPREWYLVETSDDESESPRRVYVNDVENGPRTEPVDDVQFRTGRGWSDRMLLTRRIGVIDAPWEVILSKNNGGQPEFLVYESEDGVALPEIPDWSMSVSEALAPPRTVGAYHNYWSLCDYLGGKEHPHGKGDRGEFYRSFLTWARTQSPEECEYAPGRVGHTRCEMERIWWEDRTPFCKITDEMLDPLVRSNLEIPAGIVRFPHPVMLFRLPVGHGHQGLQFEGGGDISCFLATMDERILDSDEVGIALILFHADTARSYQIGQPMNSDETVGAQFDRTHVRANWNGHMEGFRETVANALRIVTQVSLIVSGAARVEGMEGLVNPAVLARDRNRWYDPNTPREVRDRISLRAHNGVVIGREIRLPRPTVRVPVAVPAGGGTPLEYSHIRCPHFHTYLCGPGHTQIMVKYHGPIIVRPDLPPDPRHKGFRL